MACGGEPEKRLNPYATESPASNISADRSDAANAAALVSHEIGSIDTSGAVHLQLPHKFADGLGPISVVALTAKRVAVHVPEHAVLMLFDSSGRSVWSAPLPVSESPRHIKRSAVFPFGADSLAVVDDGMRQVAVFSLSGGEPRWQDFSRALSKDAAFLSRGIAFDGTILGTIPNGVDFRSDGTVTRMYDLVSVDRFGKARPLVARLKAQPELLMRTLSTDGGRSQRVSRYPAKARYFETVGVGERVHFVLSAENVVYLVPSEGGKRQSVALPPVPRRLGLRADTSFSSADVVPLGLHVASDGALWIEQPRAQRSEESKWLVLDTMGVRRGTVTVARECILRAIRAEILICQLRTAGRRARFMMVVPKFRL